MTDGMIAGGWEFVIAAYGITWAALVAYTARVFLTKMPTTTDSKGGAS